MQFVWYPSLKEEAEKQFNIKLDNVDFQIKNGIEFIKVQTLEIPSKKMTGKHLIGSYKLKGGL